MNKKNNYYLQRKSGKMVSKNYKFCILKFVLELLNRKKKTIQGNKIVKITLEHELKKPKRPPNNIKKSPIQLQE